MLFLNFYLLSFGCAGSSLLHAGFLELQGAGLLFLAAWGLLVAAASLVADRGLWGAQASVVVTRWLSCPVACGIFLDQGLKPRPLHWQMDS